jgi:hypothetical protein
MVSEVMRMAGHLDDVSSKIGEKSTSEIPCNDLTQVQDLQLL